jgi:hypothetical protein
MTIITITMFLTLLIIIIIMLTLGAFRDLFLNKAKI